MGIAVCGTHYSGMGAASYKFVEDGMGSGGIHFKGSQAAILASHGSLLFCYWVMTWSVASSVRNIASMTSNLSKVSKRDTGGPRKIVVGQAKGTEYIVRAAENNGTPQASAAGPGSVGRARSTGPQESVAEVGQKSSESVFNEV
ncbi:unnamed protein product [Phytophthora fragariaefolia]|uniref:Unnamed protein product n=1 Tax=Phytophthora fragariaefolia TaxID=1490495 RepID=A0A9W6Y633_9STRA|nr:unnamed protein product [Phytophthora fragariaefolia]